MNNHSSEMRRCLLECDVVAVRKLWHHLSPQLPQPETDAEALSAIHLARTLMGSLPLRLRAYSHAYLVRNNLPSGLPDRLRPRAEQICPPIIEGVGVMTLSACRGDPIGLAVRKVMEDVVMDHYSTDKIKKPDPVVVKRDMLRQRADYRRRVADLVTLGFRHD